ncbi:unnamed protein product [Somion occarium]
MKPTKKLWKELQNSGTELIAMTAKLANIIELQFTGTMLETRTTIEGFLHQDSKYHAWVAVRRILEYFPNDDHTLLAYHALQQYRVELGLALMDAVPGGQHYTFVDWGISENTQKIVLQATELIERFEAREIERDRITVSIPATTAGIRAVQKLKKVSIQTNLTHVTGFMHAMICIEAGANAITFHCEETLRAYRKLHRLRAVNNGWVGHPCVQAIQATIEYVERHKIPVKVMATHVSGLQVMTSLKGLNCFALRDKEMVDVQQHGVPFGPLPGSSPCVKAAKEPYPSAYLPAAKDNALHNMSRNERLLAEETCREARSCSQKATDDIAKWFRAEVTKHWAIQKVSTADIIGGYKLDVELKDKIEDMKARGQWDAKARAAVAKSPMRSGHIGYRMISITWAPPMPQEDQKADDTGSEDTLLNEEEAAVEASLTSDGLSDEEPAAATDKLTAADEKDTAASRISSADGEQAATLVQKSEKPGQRQGNDERAGMHPPDEIF